MQVINDSFEIDYQQALVRNFETNNLGHLYNLTVQSNEGPNSQNSQTRKDFLNHWSQELLQKFLHARNHPPVANLLNCESILWMAPEQDKINYQVEDFDPLFRFINLSLGTLGHRFIVIESAHLLMQRELYQKLLKTLEEPPANTTLFLLNWQNALYSQTLESRAITLSIRQRSHEMEANSTLLAKIHGASFTTAVTQLTEGLSIGAMLTAYLCGEKTLSQVLSEIGEETVESIEQLQSLILTLCQLFPIPYHLLSEIQQTNRLISEWQVYNNPRSTALVLHLRVLKQMTHLLQSASASSMDR